MDHGDGLDGPQHRAEGAVESSMKPLESSTGLSGARFLLSRAREFNVIRGGMKRLDKGPPGPILSSRFRKSGPVNLSPCPSTFFSFIRTGIHIHGYLMETNHDYSAESLVCDV